MTLLCGCEGIPCEENREVETEDIEVTFTGEVIRTVEYHVCGTCDEMCHPYEDEEVDG